MFLSFIITLKLKLNRNLMLFNNKKSTVLKSIYTFFCIYGGKGNRNVKIEEITMNN